MTRARILSMVSVAALSAAAFLFSAPRVQGDSYPSKPVCGASNSPLCTEVDNYHSAFGYYVGHDEPSLLFYSSTPGSGNNDLYTLDLPKDPPTTPVQDGSGGTFNFQLHPAFWFGMAMCDDQSAPNPGGSSFGATVPCTADNDANIFNSPDPTSPSYIGRHPGTAFMEMQFYPPGWARWPLGNSCSARQWCAALNIDSLSQNLNTGQNLNSTCASVTGLEYVNFAFITHNGVSQAPASPVNSTLATFTPDVSKDLFMISSDLMRQHSDQLPPHVLDLEHGDSGPVGGALLQRGLLRRDRTLRVLQRGQPPDPDLPRPRGERPCGVGRRRRLLLQPGRVKHRQDRRLPWV